MATTKMPTKMMTVNLHTALVSNCASLSLGEILTGKACPFRLRGLSPVAAGPQSPVNTIDILKLKQIITTTVLSLIQLMFDVKLT